MPWGTGRLRGAWSGGAAGQERRGAGWGWGSELEWRARGPLVRGARAPSPGRPASLPPFSQGPPSRRAVVAAAASPDPARREGAQEGPVPRSGRGVPQLETSLLPSSLYSPRLELPLPRRGAEGD